MVVIGMIVAQRVKGAMNDEAHELLQQQGLSPQINPNSELAGLKQG